MQEKTKWKLFKFLNIVGIVLLILLFFPAYAFLIPQISSNIDTTVFMYAHYGALAAVVIAIISLSGKIKLSEFQKLKESEKKPNIFKSIFDSRTKTVVLIIFLTIAFAVGFGVASHIHKQVSSGYVVNVKTKRIHTADCEYVRKMYEGNKGYLKAYKKPENYVDYIPCRYCLPEALYEYNKNK